MPGNSERRDSVLKRMLQTRHEPHKPLRKRPKPLTPEEKERALQELAESIAKPDGSPPERD
jgi:hypothetical protein